MSPLSHLSTRGRRNLVTLVALSVLGLSVCGLVATALATGHDLPGFEVYDDLAARGAPTPEAVTVQPVAVEARVEPVETPVPLETFEAPVQTLTIPAIRISASLVPMGVRPDGYMDLPYSPHQVAWYDFTRKPGTGGNAVFSAHVDYINYGPAVFWNLSKLRLGDDVAIKLADGTVLHYSVTESYVVPLQQLDLRGILAPTETETITLITCAGAFANDDYSHRVIVRGVRSSVQRAASSQRS